MEAWAIDLRTRDAFGWVAGWVNVDAVLAAWRTAGRKVGTGYAVTPREAQALFESR